MPAMDGLDTTRDRPKYDPPLVEEDSLLVSPPLIEIVKVSILEYDLERMWDKNVNSIIS